MFEGKDRKSGAGPRDVGSPEGCAGMGLGLSPLQNWCFSCLLCLVKTENLQTPLKPDNSGMGIDGNHKEREGMDRERDKDTGNVGKDGRHY